MVDTFDVQGLAELEKAMLELEAKVATSVLRKSARQAMAPVLTRAQSLAPEDTGALKADLKMRSKKNTSGKGKTAITINVGHTRKAPHALQQEYGTSRHAAKPYLRESLKSQSEKVLNILSVRLKENIEKAWKKAKR